MGLQQQQDYTAQILSELRVTVEARGNVVAGRGQEGATAGHAGSPSIVPDPEFQKIVADAMKEARLLSSSSARPEHLLLGLLRSEGSAAKKILLEAGLNYDDVRRRLTES